METTLENHEAQRLQERIAELEAALSDARQDLRTTRAWIRLALRTNRTAAGRAGHHLTASDLAKTGSGD